MENVFFIFDNYHYAVVAYGYYKFASAGYEQVDRFLRMYNFCNKVYRWTTGNNKSVQDKIDINDEEWIKLNNNDYSTSKGLGDPKTQTP